MSSARFITLSFSCVACLASLAFSQHQLATASAAISRSQAERGEFEAPVVFPEELVYGRIGADAGALAVGAAELLVANAPGQAGAEAALAARMLASFDGAAAPQAGRSRAATGPVERDTKPQWRCGALVELWQGRGSARNCEWE